MKMVESKRTVKKFKNEKAMNNTKNGKPKLRRLKEKDVKVGKKSLEIKEKRCNFEKKLKRKCKIKIRKIAIQFNMRVFLYRSNFQIRHIKEDDQFKVRSDWNRMFCAGERTRDSGSVFSRLSDSG